MKNSSILEKYKLFNISEDNQPNFQVLNSFNEHNNFNKCSKKKKKDIKYYNSTQDLKKN